MPRHFDALVLGLGAMGSAALYHLARRGANVLGLDQFNPPHTLGSSHGETRVIREAYFEHPVYVPLVQRAYDLWEQLERDSGDRLYLKTGGLMIGRHDSTVVTGAIRSAREHRLPHQILSAAEIVERCLGLCPNDDMTGVLEPRAGLLFPEKCIAAHLKLARAAGAQIRTNEPVTSWAARPGEITIESAAATYTASRLIVAAGAWLPRLVPSLAAWLQIERQVLLWFKSPDPALFDRDHLPIHLWEYEPDQMFYGFPDLGDGLKLAFHHQGETTTVETAARDIRPKDIQRMRELMTRFLPRTASAELLRATVCLYTNTPDGHFLLDRHPEHPNIILASPCSGHGFKFASAVGEVLADLAEGNPSAFDLSLFAFRK